MNSSQASASSRQTRGSIQSTLARSVCAYVCVCGGGRVFRCRGGHVHAWRYIVRFPATRQCGHTRAFCTHTDTHTHTHAHTRSTYIEVVPCDLNAPMLFELRAQVALDNTATHHGIALAPACRPEACVHRCPCPHAAPDMRHMSRPILRRVYHHPALRVRVRMCGEKSRILARLLNCRFFARVNTVRNHGFRWSQKNDHGRHKKK